MQDFENEVAVRMRAIEIVIEHLGSVVYATAKLAPNAVAELHEALVKAAGQPIQNLHPVSSDHWSDEVQKQVSTLLDGIRDHQLKRRDQE